MRKLGFPDRLGLKRLFVILEVFLNCLRKFLTAIVILEVFPFPSIFRYLGFSLTLLLLLRDMYVFQINTIVIFFTLLVRIGEER